MRCRAFGEYLHVHDAQAEGSRETRYLALAFNGMKRQIAMPVEERTFILAGIAHNMRTYLTRLCLRMDYIMDSEPHRRTEQDFGWVDPDRQHPADQCDQTCARPFPDQR